MRRSLSNIIQHLQVVILASFSIRSTGSDLKMHNYLAYISLIALLVSAVPVAENEKRQNAEFDYVIIGVCRRRVLSLSELAH